MMITFPAPTTTSAPTQEQREETAEELGMPALPDALVIDPRIAEGACDWLDAYVAYSKKASPEGYEAFHIFAGIGLLSMVAARRIQISSEEGDNHIVPAMKIILSARSGMYAKSDTADVAFNILEKAGLLHLKGPDKATPAKLLSMMSGQNIPADYLTYTAEKQENIRKKIAFAGQKGIKIDEFGKFLQGMLQKNSVMAEWENIILELDSCKPVYEPATIVRGVEPITNPYLGILGCMVPSNLRHEGKAGSSIYDSGLLARLSLVCAPLVRIGRPKTRRLGTSTIGTSNIAEQIIADLKRWDRELGHPRIDIEPEQDKQDNPTGKYTISEVAPLITHECSMDEVAFYAYEQYRETIISLQEQLPHEDFDASYHRLPVQAVKMAMLFASISNHNRIELRHWAKAQILAEKMRFFLHRFYTHVNDRVESEDKKIENMVMDIFKRKAQEGKTDLNAQNIRDGSNVLNKLGAKPINDALEQLRKAGQLEFVAGGKKGKFQLPSSTNEVKTALIEIPDNFEE